jgi:hypothetical protein
MAARGGPPPSALEKSSRAGKIQGASSSNRAIFDAIRDRFRAGGSEL